MGVRTSLLAITPTNTEIQTCAGDGQDLQGMLTIAAQKCADAIAALNAISDFIPAGSNKTAIGTQITALT